MPAPRVAGDRPRGFLAELQAVLSEYQVRRDRILDELLDDPACSDETAEKLRALLEKIDGNIRDIEDHITREKRRLLLRHAPDLHFHARRLDQEIGALHLQVCASASRQRGRSAHRPRRIRVGRSSRGSPARSTDDDPLDPPARVLYAHAAAFHGDPRVSRWLEAWADESLGVA